ncbi:hypothetical protein [Thermococcus waiotapuensis]|uniref:Uncharacterized protein n=1 Tax=Thermococcus waiotapuensis TaxID=90909 RepID=A0AAE4T2Q0_9EURY|nr:hypothetical protein [Thermococcus waiotapuensis]MDV3104287.1 hypothetical protein [Thermococcus waiotapuensis]
MNAWIGAVVVLGILYLIYLYSKKRSNAPKAGLMAITVYILLGLIMVYLGWNINPWIIILPGLFVALLDVIQLKGHLQKASAPRE